MICIEPIKLRHSYLDEGSNKGRKPLIYAARPMNNRGTDLFNPEAMALGLVRERGNWWDRWCGRLALTCVTSCQRIWDKRDGTKAEQKDKRDRFICY